MAIEVFMNSKHKDTDAAKFAIRAWLDASRLSPGNLAVAFRSLMNESGARSLKGKAIFLFPDKSVAAWEVTDSSWTVFGFIEEIPE